MKELCEEKELRGTVFNENTGEIIDYIYEGDSILRDKSKEANEKYERNFNKGESFLKVYDKVMPILGKKLSNAEFAFTMQLLPYISYKDNVLKFNGKILDIKELSSCMDVGYDNARKLVSSLIKKGILGRHETGCIERPTIKLQCITVNPFIFNRGTQMDKTVITLFKDSGWDKLIENNIVY
ncbi:MAG: hypothetical protein K0S18_633 [Anaerocolumna sp.]|jgi:hypothetical protein|nr:hypothetical protein [Anaerocolumna sp.]